jgi:tetratricopeptide (TPR) repeat protein
VALRPLAVARLEASADAERWRRAHAARQLHLIDVGPLGGTAEQYEAAVAADVEAARAIRWAREHDLPLAQRLAAHRGVLLVNLGRVRDAETMLRPLIESPPDDVDTRALAFDSYAIFLIVTDARADARPYADEAVRIARDQTIAWTVLYGRALIYEATGAQEESLRDYRRLIESAPQLGGARLASVLLMFTQALIATGRLEEAAERLEQTRRVAESVNASALRYIDTQTADLAMAAARPAEALDPYARSLEHAEARNDQLQVLFDLRGMANALGALAQDEAAVEVQGMAEAHAVGLGGDAQTMATHTLGDAPLQAAVARLGPELSAQALHRGRVVAPGLRVARACQFARAVLTRAY